MAIINTLQKCLDSPYLFKDDEAPAKIPGLLAKAADRLDAAANLQYTGSGDPADVSFLSYEAMFSCLRGLLVYHKGYREAGPLRVPDAGLREPLRVRRGDPGHRASPRLRTRPGPEDPAGREPRRRFGIRQADARDPGTVETLTTRARTLRGVRGPSSDPGASDERRGPKTAPSFPAAPHSSLGN